MVAFDSYDQEGVAETTHTTIDSTPPTMPVIDPQPAFTAGTENTIGWSAAVDSVSGLDHYRVNMYDQASGVGLVLTTTTTALGLTVPGLEDGSEYWYEVIAVDAVGNKNVSATESSTQDASPPSVPLLSSIPVHTKGDVVVLGWTRSSDAGVGGVEYEVQWSTDPRFMSVDGSSGWTNGTDATASALMDGTRYHFRVRARDALGHMSAHDSTAYTTVDASPPPTPVMDPMFIPYLNDPDVAVAWSMVADGSGMPVEYRVHAYTDPEGEPVASSSWNKATAFGFTDLEEGVNLHFRVEARDHLGWTSALSDPVNVTVDTTPPSIPLVAEPEGWLPGPALTVTWEASMDTGVGGVYYTASLYADPLLTELIASSDPIDGTTHRFFVSGTGTYYVDVMAIDDLGNAARTMDPAMYRVDMSPPSIEVDGEGATLSLADGSATGMCSDEGIGVDKVELSVDDGETWSMADLDGTDWTVNLGGLPAGTSQLVLRAIDGLGLVSAHVGVDVDLAGPELLVTSPEDGSTVSGSVVVVGSVTDPHLSSYTVESSSDQGLTWEVVLSTQETSGVTGVLAIWDVSGLAPGEHMLLVTATDSLDQASEHTVLVTVEGAVLRIGEGDIVLTDPRPEPGDEVTVLVTVRNDGPSPAEGVRVTVYVDGEEAVHIDDVTVPANGTVVVPVTVVAEDGEQRLTARATTDEYDTGVTPDDTPLIAVEEEVQETSGALMWLMLIIIIILVVLLLFQGQRSGREPMGMGEGTVEVDEGPEALEEMEADEEAEVEEDQERTA